jgi:DNA-binding NarL/FixJ family response regulator
MVLFLTAGIDRQQMLEALQLGVRGVLTKDATAEVLGQAVRCVLSGEYWIRRDVLAEWADKSQRKSSPAQSLTAREREIVSELLAGKTNREISAALAISYETVKFHVRNIYDKCGVSNRMELAMFFTVSLGNNQRSSP